MNWQSAVTAMRAGAIVQRASEQASRLCCGIVTKGEEPCRLADALTADRQQVMVFQGAETRCLFVPRDEHTRAQDWVVVS